MHNYNLSKCIYIYILFVVISHVNLHCLIYVSFLWVNFLIIVPFLFQNMLSHCSLKEFLSSTPCFHSKQEYLKQKLIKLNAENDTTLSTYRNQVAGSCSGNERKCFRHRSSTCVTQQIL